MKKYVYMISYEDNCGFDQLECDSVKDLKRQLKFLKEDNDVVIDVKMVENEDRWNEEDVSFTLFNEIVSLLGYEPKYLAHRGKGQRIL